MIKKFLEWIGLKEKLHNKAHRPPFVSNGDIWWVSFGENIGSEINGKSGTFTRPAIILKKLSHSFYLVAPTRRLYSKIGQIDDTDFERVVIGFSSLYINSSAARKDGGRGKIPNV